MNLNGLNNVGSKYLLINMNRGTDPCIVLWGLKPPPNLKKLRTGPYPSAKEWQFSSAYPKYVTTFLVCGLPYHLYGLYCHVFAGSLLRLNSLGLEYQKKKPPEKVPPSDSENYYIFFFFLLHLPFFPISFLYRAPQIESWYELHHLLMISISTVVLGDLGVLDMTCIVSPTCQVFDTWLT